MDFADDDTPLYLQLAHWLRDRIEQAAMGEGTRLPSVRTLAAQREISVSTALQALRWLETRGYIEARPRSGYFVAKRAKRVKRGAGAGEPKGAGPNRWARPARGSQVP